MKLSQMASDEKVLVRVGAARYEAMSKAEFLESNVFRVMKEKAEVYRAIKRSVNFSKGDIRWMVESVEGDAYDGWTEEMMNAIKNAPETEAFLKVINDVSENHPYWDVGENVEIDNDGVRKPLSLNEIRAIHAEDEGEILIPAYVQHRNAGLEPSYLLAKKEDRQWGFLEKKDEEGFYIRWCDLEDYGETYVLWLFKPTAEEQRSVLWPELDY